MTKRNEKSINFYESLTLRRNRECRINRFNLNFNRLSHSRKASQNQDKQSQNCDDHEKSIKKENQREKCVKFFEALVQFVRITNIM